MKGNPKLLTEQRGELLNKMQAIVDKADGETRAMTAEEITEFNGYRDAVSDIDATIRAIDEATQLDTAAAKPTEARAQDEQNFLAYLRGDTRALGTSTNGGIIPTSIVGRILETVKDMCPLYNLVTVYNAGGDLVFPRYDETETSIGAAYVDDMTELTESSGKFTTVKLENFIAGALVKVSKSLMNRTDFDLLGYIVQKVAEKIVEFLNKELLVGTSGKMTGILSAPVGVTAASTTAITADEIIDLQMAIPEVYQGNAVWIMHRNTLKLLRKLKGTDGQYLLNPDLREGFGWSLLGRHVYLDDNMPTAEADAVVIAYGDVSGEYLKLANNIELQVLTEKYATQHAVGVVAYVECDADIVEPQKISTLKMAASAGG